MIEEGLDRRFDGPGRTNSCDDLHGLQGVASELQEVVVDTEAGDPQHLFPDVVNGRFERRSRKLDSGFEVATHGPLVSWAHISARPRMRADRSRCTCRSDPTRAPEI